MCMLFMFKGGRGVLEWVVREWVFKRGVGVDARNACAIRNVGRLV